MILKFPRELIANVCLPVSICLHGQSFPESAAATTGSATETMRGKTNLSLHQGIEVKIQNGQRS
jgi:hypothetical protein